MRQTRDNRRSSEKEGNPVFNSLSSIFRLYPSGRPTQRGSQDAGKDRACRNTSATCTKEFEHGKKIVGLGLGLG